MESVYDLTDSLYRQGWEHAESVDDYFYGDFPVLEMKHQNSLVELFKLSLACKWRERERKALSGHIYTLPECNPLSSSRGSSAARLRIEPRGTSARGADTISTCGNNSELPYNEFYQFVSEGRDRAVW